jgi:hypothetical protein
MATYLMFILQGLFIINLFVEEYLLTLQPNTVGIWAVNLQSQSMAVSGMSS